MPGWTSPVSVIRSITFFDFSRFILSFPLKPNFDIQWKMDCETAENKADFFLRDIPNVKVG